MKTVKFLVSTLLKLLKVRSPFKTLYINFKMLPFKQAVRLPILIYGKVMLRSMKGKIVLKSDRVRPGMIRIGSTKWHPGYKSPVILTLDGTWEIDGDLPIGMGAYILTARGGVLKTGANCVIGAGSRIICFSSIIIGYNSRIPWETQIMDTSFHYIKHSGEDVPGKLTAPIVIGDCCWIGNRSTISKGTVLPNYSIVASNSVVNKDFSACGERCFYAGMPAKLKATDIAREFDPEKEAELDKMYNYTRRHL